ncbi:hypothetical protein [Acidovorax sp. ACV01]|uniref:hypothetical protein n=1 Tax=Acidovorax sp. ACV01 TaxID=2769311 RepID=UPI001CE0E82A|nr:hypothetical protein [Acidovorax sp. ACV01]
MNTGSTKPEWDTPPNGDFARYVERLSASAPARSAQAPSPGSTTASKPAAAGGVRPMSPAVPLDLAQVLMPLFGVLRTVRVVLLVLIALHAVALFVFSQGSLPGLVVMGAIWWGLGWLMEAAPKALSSAGSGATPGVAPLQERLRQVTQQRKTGKKK